MLLTLPPSLRSRTPCESSISFHHHSPELLFSERRFAEGRVDECRHVSHASRNLVFLPLTRVISPKLPPSP